VVETEVRPSVVLTAAFS